MNKKEIHKTQLDHFKWLISKGIKTTFEEVCVFQKPKIKSKPGNLDLSYLKVEDQCSNKIVDGGTKPDNSWKIEASKNFTIVPAYNKGPYMVVSKSDLKTAGKKV